MKSCIASSDDGAEVEEVALPAGFSDIIQRHRIVMAVEGGNYHEVACVATPRTTRRASSSCLRKVSPVPLPNMPGPKNTKKSSRLPCGTCSTPAMFCSVPRRRSCAARGHHRRSRVQFALELHRLADDLDPDRLLRGRLAAGDPACRRAEPRGLAFQRRRLVREATGASPLQPPYPG